ncbi:large ribosomal subunit protein mL63 [Chironomus tepperi]|uniref:large ribosomal subunit protein mL63 n=1 Tax=Chironomus tepperi TaxID=113505 RepID=UPI00391EEB85
MQLTLINLFKNTVPGHIFRGKRRLVREIKFRHIKKKLDDFQQQERNMSFLMNPYLTAEQSAGHAKELNKTAAKLKFWYDNPVKQPFKPHVKIEDRLSHLRVAEKWE